MINYENINKTLNIELFDYQKQWLEECWYEEHKIIKSTPLIGKSYFLALYAILKLLHPVEKQKVVVIGPGFRQSKIVGNYIHRILDYTNIPVSIIKTAYREEYAINGNTCICTPIGNGEKVRGLRATTLLVDDYNYIAPEILDDIVSGFMAVSSNPILDIKGKKYMKGQIIYAGRE